MRVIHYIIPLLVAVCGLFSSCAEDNGTYQYLSDEEAGVIKFDTIGIENRLALVQNMTPGQHIVFEPNVKYRYPERLRYRWFILTLKNGSYEAQQVGNKMVYPPADTISHSKQLDWNVNLEPGTYRFYLMAEDSITGMRGYYQAEEQYVSVQATGTQGGLYMLSEYDGQTDIDVMTSTLMLIYGNDQQFPHYYSSLTGHMLPGKPVFIHGTNTGSTAKDGYMVCTDQNLYRFNKVQMQEMNDWSTMFYDTPEKFAPQAFFYTNNCDFLINDGKLHVLYTNKANDRKFSAPIAGDYEAGNYLMFNSKTTWGAIQGAINADQVIYDRKNHRFRPYYAYGSSVSSFRNTTGDTIYVDANKLPADPVAILNGGSNQTYCILKNNDGQYYLYRFNFYNKVDNGNLAADGARSVISLSGCKDIDKAKYFASNTNGYAFYYATDKGVYSFSPSTGGNSSSYTIYECGANEEVTAIYSWGSTGGGWPTSAVGFWVAVWDSAKKEGKVLEYEMDLNYGRPAMTYSNMMGLQRENPTVTTGWGKIVSMTNLDAE